MHNNNKDNNKISKMILHPLLRLSKNLPSSCGSSWQKTATDVLNPSEKPLANAEPNGNVVDEYSTYMVHKSNAFVKYSTKQARYF